MHALQKRSEISRPRAQGTFQPLQIPKVHLHFTPTYSSWLNQVELWFGKIERDVIARGVFTSVADLKRKLMRYIRQHNKAPRTVKWKYADPRRHISTESVVTGHSLVRS